MVICLFYHSPWLALLQMEIALRAKNSQEFILMPMTIIKVSALSIVSYIVKKKKIRKYIG